MNARRCFALALAALCAGTSLVEAAPRPRVAVDQAATLAQQHLKERGLQDRIFVSALVLESTTVTRGQKYWYARWSESVIGDEQKKEVGLRINMDGTVVRVVQSPAKKYTDHRARADRPSVLDLKH